MMMSTKNAHRIGQTVLTKHTEMISGNGSKHIFGRVNERKEKNNKDRVDRERKRERDGGKRALMLEQKMFPYSSET